MDGGGGGRWDGGGGIRVVNGTVKNPGRGTFIDG